MEMIEWDKDKFEERSKSENPMIQKQWQQRKKQIKAVMAKSYVSAMPNKLKRQLCYGNLS